MGIIESLLDTDLYKFTMGQTVLHRFPATQCEYAFKSRNYPGSSYKPVWSAIEREIDHLCNLRFKPGELDYLRSLPYISENFVEFLRLFQFNRSHIDISMQQDEFHVRIKGPWLHTILFEVPVLAIVSECLTIEHLESINGDEGHERLREKVEQVRGTPLKFADFGTRRRFTRRWQRSVLTTFKNEVPANFVGTSNVLLAKELGIKPIGTMAHEYIQAMQAHVRLVDSQKFALENWVQEYRGDLGIALTDTIGMDAFLADFDLYFAKLFDGCRHDSGDPAIWCNKLINHYNKLGINPRTKTAVFSDGLNFDKAIKLHEEFNGRINTSFGIGTWLTNDVGFKAPQIVLKMVECNGKPVAKISDSPGKSMCEDPDYVCYLKKQFRRT